jgi:hypothetical protein
MQEQDNGGDQDQRYPNSTEQRREGVVQGGDEQGIGGDERGGDDELRGGDKGGAVFEQALQRARRRRPFFEQLLESRPADGSHGGFGGGEEECHADAADDEEGDADARRGDA